MFDTQTIEKLKEPLNPKWIKPAPAGKYGEYIEGWHVIAEANRILGFGAWSRETVVLECVSTEGVSVGRDRKPGHAVGYLCKVRITVGNVIREGTGFGSGISTSLADAHESAAKEAETDAMKRAFITFGNQFGLSLYDKQRKTRKPEEEPSDRPTGPINDSTRDWLQAQLEAARIPIVNFCREFNINSLKEIEYADMNGVYNWIKEKANAQ